MTPFCGPNGTYYNSRAGADDQRLTLVLSFQRPTGLVRNCGTNYIQTFQQIPSTLNRKDITSDFNTFVDSWIYENG